MWCLTPYPFGLRLNGKSLRPKGERFSTMYCGLINLMAFCYESCETEFTLY